MRFFVEKWPKGWVRRELVDRGYATIYTHEAPEGSFWGAQRELMLTPAGRAAGVSFGRDYRDCWAGEVAPLAWFRFSASSGIVPPEGAEVTR